MIKDETLTEYLVHLLTRIRSTLYTTLISHCFFRIGKNSKIIPPFRFANLRGIQLGSRVCIHSNCWIQTLHGSEKDENPRLILGNNVSIGMDATISAAKKIIINDHVFTARNVYISDHMHEYRDISRPIGLQGIGNVKEVVIGAHTWIGQNAVILPGVRIGKHCVIGANSIVNHDISDYAVAVGSPAKVVRGYDKELNEWKRKNG